MNKGDINTIAKSSLLGSEIVSSQTDPNFYGSLEVLPNLDAMLRKIGKVDEVYQAISQDPHVAGEIRSSMAGLLKFEIKITAVGETSADKQALALCQQVFDTQPAPNMLWSDVLWNMSKAQYLGFVVHEIIWQQENNYILPSNILDRKKNRFEFTNNGNLLVKLKGNNKSQPIDENRILLTRHQPLAQNPYGVALFSSCFWPYTFKHAGFRSYTKFINKYGIPWAIGKYPQGITNKERDELVGALQQMVEDAVAGIPDGNSVELIESKGGKQAPQESFIRLCNTEMSKALTSQTMATEQSENGSRAAGEVAREREESVDTSQRVIVEATMNKLFRLITQINIANAKPPKFSFYEKDTAPTVWVDAMAKASKFMDVSKEYAHKVTGIPMAKDDNDKLKPSAQDTNAFHDQQDEQLQAIYQSLSEADDLQGFNKSLAKIDLGDGVAKAMNLSMLDQLIKGRSNV